MNQSLQEGRLGPQPFLLAIPVPQIRTKVKQHQRSHDIKYIIIQCHLSIACKINYFKWHQNQELTAFRLLTFSSRGAEAP